MKVVKQVITIKYLGTLVSEQSDSMKEVLSKIDQHEETSLL